MNRFGRVAVLGLALCAGSGSYAQEDAARFPSKPIRMVVPFAPGGASDLTARNIQSGMQAFLGQPLVVENRAGAAGNIAMEQVARAPADGYTVFLANIGVAAINPALFKNLKVQPDKDLRGVSLVVFTPGVLVAHPSFEANSLKQLVEMAKAKPGQIAFASGGSGAVTRMEMERLARGAGIDLLHIPYKGGAGAAITDVLGGHVPMTMTSLSSVMEHLKAGRLKALAVTSAERQPLLPQVPTLAEQGFPHSVSQWQALMVPAGTPPGIISRLHGAVLAALADPKVRKAMVDAGQTPATSKSPAELDEFVRSEMTAWGELVRQIGATPD